MIRFLDRTADMWAIGWLLIDRATGKGISVTIWDSMDNMNAGESSGYYQEQVGKFAPLLTAPPTREVFEVVVQG